MGIMALAHWTRKRLPRGKHVFFPTFTRVRMARNRIACARAICL